jgi:prepilin-type N-terminal cleavage/methylation domain-containing protein
MKGERGYTLVEMLIAIAITGCIAAVTSVIVRQVVTVPEQGNAHVDALHALQSAAHWVSLDGQTAKSASGGSSLILALPDSSNITYAISGSSLQRTSDNVTRTVAEDISSVIFSVQGRVITMSITATPGNRWSVSENQTYEITMRPTG